MGSGGTCRCWHELSTPNLVRPGNGLLLSCRDRARLSGLVLLNRSRPATFYVLLESLFSLTLETLKRVVASSSSLSLN